MSDYEGRRIYQRNFIKDELSLLRQTIEGEIKFCEKQIQIADDEEDDRNIKDKVHIRHKVIETYDKLKTEYESMAKKLREDYEERQLV